MTVTTAAIVIEVSRIWWISIEVSVLCHQSRPHFGIGKVK